MAQDLTDAEQVFSGPKDGLRFGRGRIAQNIWDLLTQNQIWQSQFLAPAQLYTGDYSFADGTGIAITNIVYARRRGGNGPPTSYSFDYRPGKYYINVPYHLSGQVDVTNGTVTLASYPDGGGAPSMQQFALSYLTTVRVGQDETPGVLRRSFHRRS